MTKMENKQPKSNHIITYIKYKWTKHSNKKAEIRLGKTQLCGILNVQPQRHNRMKGKKRKKIYHEDNNRKRGGVVILVSGKRLSDKTYYSTQI